MKTKNIPALIAALAALFALPACDNKPADKPQPAAQSKSSGSSESANNAAIGFHNNLIELIKTARGPLDKIIKTSKQSEEYVQRQGIPSSKPMWNMALIGINPFDKVAKDKIAPPGSFSKEDQAFFNTRIKATKDAAAELNGIVSTLTAYYKAEDYKDDKHKKFLDLQPRIGELVQQIAQATGEMGERSQVIASAAERENLKKNPIGIYILHMRDIMAKCEEQMDILMDDRMLQVGSGTERRSDAEKAAAVAKVQDIIDAADALTKEIEEMATKAKAEKMTALKDRPALAKAYEEFFVKLEDQQGAVRKNLRFAKEQGYIGTKSVMENLGKTVQNVIRAHNNFIDNVNRGR